jgi:hypothetical protein
MGQAAEERRPRRIVRAGQVSAMLRTELIEAGFVAVSTTRLWLPEAVRRSA